MNTTRNQRQTAELHCLERFKPPILSCGLLVLLSMAGCSSDAPSGGDAESASQAVEIIAQEVTFRPDTVEIQAVGTARAENTASIRAKEGGEVTQVFFTAGDKVAEGDILLALERDEEQLAVEQARVSLKDAEQLIARFEGITLPGAISDTRIDEVKIAAERARIELRLAEVALARRQVRAPFSGIVGITDLDAGARITSETVITQLDDRTNLYVDFQAPESVYGQITAGDQINIEPFSDLGQRYKAKVYKVDSRINEVSRSFTVRAQIDNANDKFRPGMSFKIEFSLPGRLYPVVPEAAIVWGGDGAYVWMVEDDKATRVTVTIVSRQEGQVLVRAPINQGAVVVAEGVQKVREGTPVKLSEVYARESIPEPRALPAVTSESQSQNVAPNKL